MPIPSPRPNLVLRYAYLWHADHRRGQEESGKDRPCVIVLSAPGASGHPVVTVLPITHTPPLDPAEAVEIPPSTKQRLGMDAERSWIVCSEINRFLWPGPDLRPIPGRPGEIVYGDLPSRLFEQVKDRVLTLYTARRLRVTTRTS